MREWADTTRAVLAIYKTDLYQNAKHYFLAVRVLSSLQWEHEKSIENLNKLENKTVYT